MAEGSTGDRMASDAAAADPPVRFETRGAPGRRIGVAWLNRPRRLNALDLEMCESLSKQFGAWAADDAVVAVVLAGEGSKAFCAGGDVNRVVQEVGRGGPDRYVYGDSFFTTEYRLDLMLHTYPKPLVTWAHGVTMGGGLGLSVAGSHRFVTTGSRIAMPEIHIGLFPDVGGGWFLNRVPGEAGLMMALTGVNLNEQDVVYARMADYIADPALRPEFLDGMTAIPWGDTVADHRAQLTHYCRQFEANHPVQTARSELRERYSEIRSICTRAKLGGILKGLQEAAAADPWYAQPAANLAGGSPTAAAVTLEYLRRCRLLGLAQVLELDLVLAMQCLRHPDFPEGVRALLIDKDKSPRWSPREASAVTPALVQAFFTPPR